MDRLLPLRALTRLLAVEEATIRDWIAAGRFPAPVCLPDGQERWRSSAVTAWQALLGMATPQGHQAREQQEVDIESLSELGQDILQALTEMEDGWHPAREVAAKVGGEADNSAGNWGRAIKELREAGLIATGKKGLLLQLNDAPSMPSSCPIDA